MRTREPPPAVVEWLDERGHPIEQNFTPGAVDPAESVRDAAHWLLDHVEQAQAVKATPGPRLGVKAELSTRRGTTEEVVKPVFVDPHRAMATASTGDLFSRPLARVVVDPSTYRDERGWCVWSATVSTHLWRKRQAYLRIGPSRSGNLTVLQLVPNRSSRMYGRAFVRAGVPAIAELSTRIESRYTASARGCSSTART